MWICPGLRRVMQVLQADDGYSYYALQTQSLIPLRAMHGLFTDMNYIHVRSCVSRCPNKRVDYVP